MTEESAVSGSQDTEHRSLLGRLAWKGGLDEPFATDALAVILEQPDIRSAVLDYLQVRFIEQEMDVELRGVVDLLPQLRDTDHGRPDIVGSDAQGHPILVIEAKFDHHLHVDQVMRYLALQRRDVPGTQFALVLVVPKYRVDHATGIAREAAQQLGLDVSRVLALSWQDVLDVVESAAGALGTSHRSYSADAAQLRDLVEYRTHTGLESIDSVLIDEVWDTPLPYYALVNAATRRVDEIRGTSRYLRQPIDGTGFGPFHYVSEPAGLLYSLGPHRAFASNGLGPLWVRIGWKPSAEGRELDAIRSRLTRSGGWALRDDWGYAWVPIDLGDLQGAALFDHVVEQLVAVLEVAFPSSASADGNPEPAT